MFLSVARPAKDAQITQFLAPDPLIGQVMDIQPSACVTFLALGPDTGDFPTSKVAPVPRAEIHIPVIYLPHGQAGS